MSSRAQGWTHIKFDQFQLRINQIMSSRAPGWIHIKFDQFSIKNQSNNEL